MNEDRILSIAPPEHVTRFRCATCRDTLMVMHADERDIAYGGQCKEPACVDERGRRCAANQASHAPTPKRREKAEFTHWTDDTPDDGIPF